MASINLSCAQSSWFEVHISVTTIETTSYISCGTASVPYNAMSRTNDFTSCFSRIALCRSPCHTYVICPMTCQTLLIWHVSQLRSCHHRSAKSVSTDTCPVASEGCRGTTNHCLKTFLHLQLSSVIARGNSVHSPTLSCRRFFCQPLLLHFGTVPPWFFCKSRWSDVVVPFHLHFSDDGGEVR